MALEVVYRNEGKENEIKIEFDFGDNLSQMIQLVGEVTVYNHARHNQKEHVKTRMLQLSEAGHSPQEIQREMNIYKIPPLDGSKPITKTQVEAVQSMTPEQLQEIAPDLIEQIRRKLLN